MNSRTRPRPAVIEDDGDGTSIFDARYGESVRISNCANFRETTEQENRRVAVYFEA